MTKKTVLLFQGDSITDCNRNLFMPLGDGYVSKVADAFPNVSVLNKGISGNRVIDLKNRWVDDTLALHPDILCILVGVNEVWHNLCYDKPYTDAQYEHDLKWIIAETKAQNPNLKLIMLEPFLLEVGVVTFDWIKPLERLRKIFRSVALVQADAFIPLQDIFNQASRKYKPKELLPDGVHPSDLGHQFIALALVDILPSLL